MKLKEIARELFEIAQTESELEESLNSGNTVLAFMIDQVDYPFCVETIEELTKDGEYKKQLTEFLDERGIKLVYVEAFDFPIFSQKRGVDNIPYFMGYSNGEIVGTGVGFFDQRVFKALLSSWYD